MYRLNLDPFTGDGLIVETFTFYGAYKIAVEQARAAGSNLSRSAHVRIEKLVPDVLTGTDARWVCTVSNVHGYVVVAYNGRSVIIREAGNE